MFYLFLHLLNYRFLLISIPLINYCKTYIFYLTKIHYYFDYSFIVINVMQVIDVRKLHFAIYYDKLIIWYDF